jgi:hypothetical protein
MKALYSTLALLVLVAGGGAWIYFNEREPVAAPNSTVLLREEPTRVRQIAITRAGGERFVLSKKNNDWMLQREGVIGKGKSPVVPADRTVVQSLLKALQLVQSSAPLSGANREELGAYGLSRPMSTLLVEGAKIEFGTQPSFDRAHVYARVTSKETTTSQIALLPVSLALFGQKTFDDWRDKSTLRLDLAGVKQLEIQTPRVRTRFALSKRSQNNQPDEWQMLVPLNAHADPGTIHNLLQALPRTLAPRFLDDAPNLKKWGLGKPAFVVRATGSSVSTLRVGSKVPGGFAAQNSSSPSVFVMPDELMKLINRPLRDWRGKRVLFFEVSKVDAFDLRARGKTASFARDPNDEELRWQQLRGPTRTASPDAIQHLAVELLFGLKDFAATDFIDAPRAPGTYGLDKPVLEYRLRAAQWPGGVTVQVGAKNGKFFARTGARTGKQFQTPIYILPSDSLDPLKAPLDAMFPTSKR